MSLLEDERAAGLQWVDIVRPSLGRDWVVGRRAGSVGWCCMPSVF